MARLASGGRHGLAQSLFQVGGNAGSALGPLLAAFIVVPGGQGSIAWFSVAAVAAMAVLLRVGRWYRAPARATGAAHRCRTPRRRAGPVPPAGGLAVAILLCLIFSKYFYLASLTSYYTFYLIETFGVSVQDGAALSVRVPRGRSRSGRSPAARSATGSGARPSSGGRSSGRCRSPWSCRTPTCSGPAVLTVPIGLILASAFSAILVYAQELLPGRVGLVAGLFFGFAFGMGGLGAAALGRLADLTSITSVYRVCSFLPLLGLLMAFLPRRPGAPSMGSV